MGIMKIAITAARNSAPRKSRIIQTKTTVRPSASATIKIRCS